jgi:hypothetical protein
LFLLFKLSFFKFDKVGSHTDQRHHLAGYLQIFLDLIGEELLADVLFREAVGGWILVNLLRDKCLTMGIGDIQYSTH